MFREVRQKKTIVIEAFLTFLRAWRCSAAVVDMTCCQPFLKQGGDECLKCVRI